MTGRSNAKTTAVAPVVPSIRSRLPVLVAIFSAALLVAFGATLWIFSGLRPALTPDALVVSGLYAVAFASLVVVAVIPLLFQRPLVEAWSLGGIAPGRRPFVRRAVWSDLPESLDPVERLEALRFARLYVQNTPHRLLQGALCFVVIAVAVAVQLVLGSTQVLLISVVYPVVLVVFVGSGLLRRRRQCVGAAAFLQSASAPVSSSAAEELEQ